MTRAKPGPKIKPPAERFWAKVDKSGECWLWTGSLDHHGYANFNSGTGTVRAHRWLWEQANGPIPEGMFTDHLCRDRACVRPDHLEIVTPKENVLRGDTLAARKAAQTHCIHGHSLHDAYKTKLNQRKCRTCVAIRGARRYRARRDA